jgi:2',3'-cyclic-nucleotide 2'-phosphodiesterase (5'-nucleotidase family)
VVQNLLPILGEISDVRIVLSHLGYSLRASSATVLMAGDVELAEALPPGSIHAIIGGHTHHASTSRASARTTSSTASPSPRRAKWASFVGEVDITVGRRWAAVTSVQLLPTARTAGRTKHSRRRTWQPLVQAVQPIFAEDLGEVVDDPDLSIDAVRNEFAAGESALATS